jgi:hypothetical protein
VGRLQIPRPQKINRLGEDVLYVSKDRKCFGVFDGLLVNIIENFEELRSSENQKPLKITILI